MLPIVSTSLFRLRPLTFLPPSKPRSSPPTSVVFTLWLSRLAALGCASRPSAKRTGSRSAALIACHAPSRAPAPKMMLQTVLVGIFLRQHLPLTACFVDIKQRIHHTAHLQFSRSAPRLYRSQCFDNYPLLMRQIA